MKRRILPVGMPELGEDAVFLEGSGPGNLTFTEQF
jgi:hypothetical protein